MISGEKSQNLINKNKIMSKQKDSKETQTKPELDTLLGNVSIAKMLAIKLIKGINEYTGKEYYYYNNYEMQDYEALPSYDYDWSALMPVVEEINKRDWVTILADECKIHSLMIGEFETIKITKEGQPLISIVYAAILKYAEWYNLKYNSNVA
jgi:hypothetical protein